MTDAALAGLLRAGAAATARFDWNRFWASGFGQALWIVVQVVVIIVIALVVRAIAHQVIRMFVNRIVTGVKRRRRAEDTQALLASPVSAARVVQRTRTLGSVLNNVVSTVVAIIALISIVSVINANITSAFSLITAALGAGLGFGAQSLVKDILAGLFMVADDQLGVGDVVTTDLATGMVEAVGIRVTQIRDVNGVLWYVRNGELTRVGNMSQGWARAVVDVTVPKGIDIEAVQQRLLAVATAVLDDPQWRQSVVEKPELWGLESVTADGVVLRLVVRTRTNTKDDVAWSLRTHMREALVAAGVEPTAISSAPLPSFEQAGSLRGVRPIAWNPPSARRPHARAARPAEGTAVPAEALPGATAPSVPRTRPRAGARGVSGQEGAAGRQGAAAPDDASDVR